MKSETKTRGTCIHRFAIRFFTVMLAVLVFWVLGFLVNDIQSIDGPDYSAIEKKHVDPALLRHLIDLEEQIAELSRQIDNQTERQRVVGDSSRNLQQTINQLIELQKLGLQKNLAMPETEQSNFSNSLNLFLDNQRKYQDLSQTVSDMLERKQSLVHEQEQTQEQLEQQRRPAREEYETLLKRHHLKLAAFQLAILLPILAWAAAMVLRKRGSIYFPLFFAFGTATLVKVALVVHRYFPTRYFKYILIGGLLVVVVRLLVYFIRAIAYPKTQWLVNQYREAYERFLCPVCEYPIRTGPRRFLYWTRRTVNKTVLGSDRTDHEETYTCPACGDRLFEECPACHKVRHALLPHCTHCGVSKEIGN